MIGTSAIEVFQRARWFDDAFPWSEWPVVSGRARRCVNGTVLLCHQRGSLLTFEEEASLKPGTQVHGPEWLFLNKG